MRATRSTARKAALLAAQQQLAANRARVDRTTIDNHPGRAQRGRARARRLSDLRAHDAAGAGLRLRRQARRAARSARQPGRAADGDRAARPGVGRRQLQGAAARGHARRPAGDAHGRHLRRQGRCITARSPASVRAPARRSRCCRRRTRRATGSRSCSAFRCASRSTRRSSPRIRCRSACRCRSRSTRTSARASACRSSRKVGRPAYATDVFQSLDAAAERSRQGDHRGQRAAARRNGGRGQVARARRRPRRRRVHAGRSRRVRRPSSPSRRARSEALARNPANGFRNDRIRRRRAFGGCATRAVSAAGTADRRHAGARHDRAVARDVHERARHVDRQRVDPGDRGRPRRVARPGHVGDHVVRRRQRDFAAADRLADAALSARCACSPRRCCCSCSRRSCARLAPSLELLILFRVIQGAVAGPMIPLSQSLLLSSYPKENAGTALAMWAITTLVAPVVGPLLGGWITDNISWPWIFYINVPVGIAAAARDVDDLPHARDADRASCRSTPSGLGCSCVWVGALQIMLDKGKDLDWFDSGQIVALAIVAVVGFRVLPGLGADRPASGGRPAPVRAAQFLDQHARDVARLRHVLRQRRAAAAVAAAVHGLHRDAGRDGARAGRRARDPADAAGRQEHQQGRSARLFATGGVRDLRAGAVHALALQHRRRLQHAARSRRSSRAPRWRCSSFRSSRSRFPD